MFTIPARITGVMSSAEMTALREEKSAGDIADQFRDSVVGDYTQRDVESGERHRQDSMALFYLLGGLEYYLREGGDPEVMKIAINALNFATSH